jgi:hypothetical protein
MVSIRRMNPVPVAPPKTGAPPPPTEAGSGSVAVVDDRARPGLAPPGPSAMWRQRHDYAGGRDNLVGSAVKRAWANYRRWQTRHGELTGQVQEWCASEGLFGPDAQAALAAHLGQGALQRKADSDVVAARARLDRARAELGEAVRAGGELPSGRPVVTAQDEIEAAEAVAAAVRESAAVTLQAWGRCVTRADWRAALAAAEQLEGPEAAQAAIWIRARLQPPLSPAVDPAGWW